MGQSYWFPAPDFYAYYQSIAAIEDPILTALRRETERQFPQAARMLIPPEQAQLLAFLVQVVGAQRVLELGTFTGYSALALALALPPTGHVVTCDREPTFAAMAERFWQAAGLRAKITLRLGLALDTLAALRQEPVSFDLIFLDADKGNIEAYYEAALALVRAGGLIVVDNVFLGGAVVAPHPNRPGVTAFRRFNTALLQDRRVVATVLPMADGVTVVWKK
ncbi:MAG: class I SAM-dependent methyltransferase [Pseudanabaenaceae cyanobacterium]